MLYILFYYVWKPRFRSEVENRNQPVEKKTVCHSASGI